MFPFPPKVCDIKMLMPTMASRAIIQSSLSLSPSRARMLQVFFQHCCWLVFDTLTPSRATTGAVPPQRQSSVTAATVTRPPATSTPLTAVTAWLSVMVQVQ